MKKPKTVKGIKGIAIIEDLGGQWYKVESNGIAHEIRGLKEAKDKAQKLVS